MTTVLGNEVSGRGPRSLVVASLATVARQRVAWLSFYYTDNCVGCRWWTLCCAQARLPCSQHGFSLNPDKTCDGTSRRGIGAATTERDADYIHLPSS